MGVMGVMEAATTAGATDPSSMMLLRLGIAGLALTSLAATFQYRRGRLKGAALVLAIAGLCLWAIGLALH